MAAMSHALRPRTPPAVLAAFDALSATGARVGVALSAGADSTLALLESVERFGAARVVALHYNHAIRGAASDEDARAAADLAASLGVAILTERRPEGLPSDEASLRADRIRFLHRMAKAHALAAIITGHHADDVVETLLLRIARGSGTAGLAAPRPVSHPADGPPFLRPLLHCAKSTVLAALRERGLSWREDAGNADAGVARRNAIRLHVAPEWKRLAGPDPLAGAIRTRQLLQEDDDALEHWAERELARVAPGTDGENWLIASALPRAVTRRMTHRWLLQSGLHHALSARAVDRLVDHLAAGTPTTMSVAHGFLEFRAGKLTHLRRHPETPRADAPLPVPGAVFWPDGAHLTATIDANATHGIAHERENGPLVLCCRQATAGERYAPAGAPGSAKISDMLINRKVPVRLRKRLPLVADAEGPVWMPGLVPAGRVVKSDLPSGALRLTWKPPDAP